MFSFCCPFYYFEPSEKDESRQRYIRPFTISPAPVKLPSDAALYRDQSLSKTAYGKCSINNDRIPITKLKLYIAKELSAELVNRTSIDQNNIETTKIIQNLYVTSFGGLNAKTIKNYKINLLLNATVDLPMVDFPKMQNETLRVPITESDPETLNLYLSDAADKIHENYLKNGYTLVYCHDGTLNSMALMAGYLLKYTDLLLTEALLHLRYSRNSFDLCDGNLGHFRDIIDQYARRLNKNDITGIIPESSYSRRHNNRNKNEKSYSKSNSKKTTDQTGKQPPPTKPNGPPNSAGAGGITGGGGPGAGGGGGGGAAGTPNYNNNTSTKKKQTNTG